MTGPSQACPPNHPERRHVVQASRRRRSHLTGVIVDPHGDDADVRANVVATFCDEEHRPTLEGASVWRGRLRRSGDDWQVSEFSLNLAWSCGTIPAAWGVAS
jgi:hypothetical protein